jgi:hypothetical protein
MNTTPKTEDQIANAAINLAVKKVFYEFDSEQNPEAILVNLDIKDQNHIIEVVKEVVKDLTDKELLKVYPDTTVSLTTDGISYILTRVPKNYF